MFNLGPKPKTGIEKAISAVLLEMDSLKPDSAEYAKMVKQLVKLHALKENETPKRISPDTLAAVLGNLVIVVVIVTHERAHVITSKALQFVNRAG